MRANRYIIKGVSILLILVMMQKTGGGLCLHNWLHTQNTRSTSPDTPAIGQKNANCSCIDDFYLPFTETPEQIIQPLPVIIAGVVAVHTSSISFVVKVFHSLRGPPLKA